jgi:antirestriction protein ArdC
MSTKVYEIITERIIEELEKGTAPWHKPWASGEMPKSLISKKEYRGLNIFLLNSRGFTSPYFLSFKQCKEKGGSIRSGEKGTPVIFWKWLEKEDEDGNPKKYPLLRYYTVFNVSQCESIEDPFTESTRNDFTPIDECERIVDGMPLKPEIKLNGVGACYSPIKDMVYMPLREQFDNPEYFYSTLFHELTHSTGHESRLNRDVKNGFGSEKYSKEELIAEMGASFLCGISGIENKTVDNSASYINSWLSRLKKDKKLVVLAGANAQKAVDFIRGKELSLKMVA